MNAVDQAAQRLQALLIFKIQRLRLLHQLGQT